MSYPVIYDSKAMAALMGKVVPVSSNEEVVNVLMAMRVLQGYEFNEHKILELALQYCSDGTAKYIVVNRVMDDIHISILLESPDYPLPEDLDTEEGVFAYVYNVSYELDSELGYIFFNKDASGCYHRIG